MGPLGPDETSPDASPQLVAELSGRSAESKAFQLLETLVARSGLFLGPSTPLTRSLLCLALDFLFLDPLLLPFLFELASSLPSPGQLTCTVFKTYPTIASAASGPPGLQFNDPLV